MKRLHIHISVNDLSESIDFYNAIFGAKPSTQHEDYAKWSLTNPSVNFAISKRGNESGINHLGIQVDSEKELSEIQENLEKANILAAKQENASCCYANSNKHWTLDPQGVVWESFHTLGNIEMYGEDSNTSNSLEKSACCIPSDMG